MLVLVHLLHTLLQRIGRDMVRHLMLTQETVMDALRGVKYPGYSRDIVSFGLVKELSVREGAVSLLLQLTSSDSQVGEQLKIQCEQTLKSLPDAHQVIVQVKQPAAQTAGGQAAAGQNPWSQQTRVPGIGRVVAVASGKGGVGKSTVAVNLACALQHLGARVGLLDCDIYGPSIPLMMGINQRPTVSAEEKLVPPANHGVKLMSMGFLLDGDQPVIWRGPMIMKTIQQFVLQVDWGELDYLLVDLPPGTGDAQLSLCQTVPLDGGVIVTTPQEASLGVVRKGIAMFEKVNVPILGIIENMSYFTTPDGQRIEIFGHGGGSTEAKRQSIPFLGEIPIYTEIRIGGDLGTPVVVSAPKDPPAQAFVSVATALRRTLG
jgi:ATP-binding protein involved in chromosome partitioning